jgi:carboxylesterase
MRVVVALAPIWSEYVGEISSNAPRSIHDPVERAKNLAYPGVTGRVLRELARVSKRARQALPRITTPTLLIQSREDNRVSMRVAKKAFAALGSAQKQLCFTSGAGHIITVDYGKEHVFEEVRAWLGGGPGTVPPEPDVTNGFTPSGKHLL